jgi:hypothetical protein
MVLLNGHSVGDRIPCHFSDGWFNQSFQMDQGKCCFFCIHESYLVCYGRKNDSAFLFRKIRLFRSLAYTSYGYMRMPVHPSVQPAGQPFFALSYSKERLAVEFRHNLSPNLAAGLKPGA